MSQIPEIKMPIPEFFSWDHHDPIGLKDYIFNTYGDISQFKIGHFTNYFFMHPDYAQVILGTKQDDFFYKHPFLVKGLEPIVGTETIFTMNDPEKWEKNRRLAVQPLDAMFYFERYAKKLYETGEKRVEGWFQKYKDNEKVNMAREFGCMTLSAIHNSFFYYIDDNLEEMHDMLYRCARIIIGKQTSLNHAEWETPEKKKLYSEAVQTLRETYLRWVRTRLDSGAEIDDFMGVMIHEYAKEYSREKLIDQIARHAAMASNAGFFTTSPAVLWLFIQLARHPNIEKKMCEEIKRVIGDGQPTYDQLKQLTYCNAVIKESMRLNSTSYNQLRESVVDTSVQDYFIPKGSGIFICTSQIHRHPDFWKYPDVFDPDRFLDKAMGQDHPFAYIPFGAGKRSCIARHLVFLEFLIVLVLVTRRFSFELLPFKTIKPIMTAPITMRPNEDNLIIKFKKT